MKKFVRIQDYDSWFWLVESVDDLDENFVRDRIAALQNAVKRDLYIDETKTTIRLDWLARVQTTLTEEPDYQGALSKFGDSLLINKNGSYMALRNHKIVAYMNSDDFPADNVSNIEIVICENDAWAEPNWIKYLNNTYPGKSFLTLNYFSDRTNSLNSELNVPIISFSTTFTSYDWFERILDTIIRNKWSDKEIVGYSHDPSKWNFPKDIQNKIDKILNMGNVLKIVHNL